MTGDAEIASPFAVSVDRSSVADSAFGSVWFQPWLDRINQIGHPASMPGEVWLERINHAAAMIDLRNALGRRIRFEASLPTAKPKAGPPAYETGIFEHGVVPTRIHGEAAWHDYFNALVWLVFPRTKAALNQRQARAIALDGISAVRGPLRDALTLFDESAALIACPGSSFGEDLRQFNWNRLFIERRGEFVAQARCVVFGHALLHKLVSPYKAVCGHAMMLDSQLPDSSLAIGGREASPEKQDSLEIFLSWLDREASCMISAAEFGKQSLTPLPILGIPGWWPANEHAEFYNDSNVFRRKRT